MNEPEHPALPIPAIFDGAALEVLEEILSTLRSASPSLAVTEKAVHQALAIDFPFQGSQRWVLPRIATGGILPVSASTPTAVLEANPNRLGGTIVNLGAATAILYLTDVNELESGARGIGPIPLVGAGESWDLRLGDLFWSGSVSVEASKETELTVVEV